MQERRGARETAREMSARACVCVRDREGGGRFERGRDKETVETDPGTDTGEDIS